MRAVKEIVEEAFAMHGKGDLAGAEYIYDQLIGKLEKPDPNVLYGFGSLLTQKGQHGLGAFLMRVSLGFAPEHAPTWTNLGVAYKWLGEHDLSLKAFERALEIEPNASEPLAGLAGHYINRDNPQLVEKYARQAVAANPDNPSAHMNLGLGLLEQGRFEEAWPHYESRWETLDNRLKKRPYKAPQWDGKKVRKLAIHGEQGLGDEILFMSLFRKAQERANEVVVECATRLVNLFEHSFDVECYGTHDELIAAEGEPDAYIPMGSLPLVLGLPDGKPYLEADRWRHLKSHKPVIGLAWKGGTPRTNRDDRSLALADFKPIMNAIDAEFVSVQYGGEEIERECAEFGLSNHSRDFDHLTSTIAGCDLVISVCQTAIHQAGALGVPVWVLTPRHAPWVCCGPDLRPWYNCGRIFRQREAAKWFPVITEVCQELRKGNLRAAA